MGRGPAPRAVHDGPGLVAQAPAAHLVVEPGQRVGDGVVVRPDGKAVPLQVVTDVDHDRQLGAEMRGKALGQLRAADLAGELDDLHRARVFATSPIRAMVSWS